MKRFGLAICLLTLWSTSLFAASEPAEKPEPDPRLDEKVTIKAVGKPLGDFCKEVTAQTGVKLNTRKDAADIKVAVFVKDVPLSSLRDALKDCLHLMCTREGKKGEWTYHFWEDLKTAQEPERVRREQITKLREHVDDLAKQLADMEAEGKNVEALLKEANSYTGQKLADMARTNPEEMKRILNAAGPFRDLGALLAMTTYSGLSQAQVQALWAGQTLDIRPEDLPPGVREKFAARANVWMDALREPWMDKGEPWVSMYRDRVLCGITLSLSSGKEPTLDYRLDSDIPGKEHSTSVSPGSVVVSYEGEPEADEEATPPAEDTPEDAAKPDLKLVITHKTSPYELMEQAFDLTGICIVSDYYTRVIHVSPTSDLASGSVPHFKTGGQVLKAIAQKTNWRLAGNENIRTVSSRTWIVDRQREISERLLAKWRKAKEQYGGMRLEEALEMADLNEMQLDDLRDVYMICEGAVIQGRQQTLRLVKMLTADQWKQAVTETGLPISVMSAAQMALVSTIAQEAEKTNPNARDGQVSDPEKLRDCVLKIDRRDMNTPRDDTKAWWSFSIDSPGGVGFGASIALDHLNSMAFASQ